VMVMVIVMVMTVVLQQSPDPRDCVKFQTSLSKMKGEML
jgi:hypothetical protein